MSDKRLKYEKPMSIDLGRVAPILGDTCSVGNGAADCPAGMNNAMVAVCVPSGSGADNDCRVGSSAGTFCWPTGSGAAVYCLVGSGFGSVQSTGYDSDVPSTLGGGLDSLDGGTDSLGGTEPTSLPGGEPDSGGITTPGAF
ncbi:MAG: hypothetical protein PHU50_02200 [Kiritimatiellae bacterium]|nr:hypothetical protein [Kiritimatiellia bacterium]